MSQLYFVVTRGHNGGEFLSYLINQSPDFENTGKLIYEEYPSFLGTHYRIDDDWNIRQWDEFTEYYNEHVRDRRAPPYTITANHLTKLQEIWKQESSSKKNLCLFLNVTHYIDVIKLVKSTNCKAIGSILNLPDNPARHHHTMMEFDPNSTGDTIINDPTNINDGHEGPIADSYTYQELVEELVDWHKDELLVYDHNYFDYVFDHSRITDMDYVLDMYNHLKITPPTAEHLHNVIGNYYHINRPQHEFTRKINQEILHF